MTGFALPVLLAAADTQRLKYSHCIFGARGATRLALVMPLSRQRRHCHRIEGSLN